MYNTAGSSLIIGAGGATFGATDKNGGNLVLSSGISTGTGFSNIVFKTPTAGGTGTTDNTPETKLTLTGAGVLMLKNGETIDNNTDGDISLGGANLINYLAKPSSKTASATITAAESGTVFHNAAATGAITLTLPPAAAGLVYTFVNTKGTQMVIDPAASDTDDQIVITSTVTNAIADSISNSTIGDAITLVAINTSIWIATSHIGTWTDNN